MLRSEFDISKLIDVCAEFNDVFFYSRLWIIWNLLHRSSIKNFSHYDDAELVKLRFCDEGRNVFTKWKVILLNIACDVSHTLLVKPLCYTLFAHHRTFTTLCQKCCRLLVDIIASKTTHINFLSLFVISYPLNDLISELVLLIETLLIVKV